MAMALDEALTTHAIAAFQRAVRAVSIRGEHGHGARKVLIAVDASVRVILEVLAYGNGGKQLYEQLHVTRLVAIDTASMDADAIRRQIGVSANRTRSNTSAESPSSSSSRLSSGGAAPPPPAPSAPDVVFVVPSTPSVAALLARTVYAIASAEDPSSPTFSVLWLPAVTPECSLEMERQGLAGIVRQRNLPLGLLPVDHNVASLCHDSVFADLYVHGQQHALTEVVRSILAIERHTSGIAESSKPMAVPIRDITCHGVFAERVKHMLGVAHGMQAMDSVSRSSVPRTEASSSSSFQRLVLIDRMEDPLSMLLTPMTYEGLLDSLVGMNHGIVSVKRAAANASTASSASEGADDGKPTSETVKVLFNDMDDLFQEIRDVNINHLITDGLARIAQGLVDEVRVGGTSEATASRRDSPENTTMVRPSQAVTSLAEVTALLHKVPHLVKKKRSLGYHLTLVERIQSVSQGLALRSCVETEMAILSSGMKRGLRLPTSTASHAAKDVDRFLEEAVLRDPPLLNVYDIIKLLCLRSLATGGLKEDMLQWYRHQLCHTYGFHILPLLVRLDKLELLSTKNTLDYPRRRRELALISDVANDDTDNKGVNTTNGDPHGRDDIHFMFPYAGYAPMSVRLVQRTLGFKLKGKDIMSMSMASIVSKNSNSSSASTTTTKGNTSAAAGSQPVRQRVLVYYIGGVTVAELAAFRRLNTVQSEFEFFVATTAICNGSRLLRTM